MNYMKDLKEWLHDAKHGLEQQRLLEEGSVDKVLKE
jgi:hypothetical protein